MRSEPRPDNPQRRLQFAAVMRALLGPPALAFVAAVESVRLRGPVTVSLTYPSPPVTTVIGDVLAVFVLATLALWAASIVAGCRSSVASFLGPVAASQLPMALVALVVGRQVLGGVVYRAMAGHGEDLLATPWTLTASLLPTALAVLASTALAVGVLYVGYRRATRLHGYRLILSFAGGLIAAEVICRVWFLLAG